MSDQDWESWRDLNERLKAVADAKGVGLVYRWRGEPGPTCYAEVCDSFEGYRVLAKAPELVDAVRAALPVVEALPGVPFVRRPTVDHVAGGIEWWLKDVHMRWSGSSVEAVKVWQGGDGVLYFSMAGDNEDHRVDEWDDWHGPMSMTPEPWPKMEN